MSGTPEPPETSSAQEEKPKTKKQERSYAKYVLPSNRHPFTAHFEVLRRVVARTRNGQGLSTAELEGQGIPPQAVSLNVRFLKSIGLLTSPERNKYAATEEAAKFITARTVSDDRARPILAALLNQQWFAQVARAQLTTQPLMTQDQLVGELALEAQADRAKEEVALRVMVEYLVYAGILVRDERGVLSLGQAGAAGEPAGATDEVPMGEPSGPTTAAPAPPVGASERPMVMDRRPLPAVPAGFHVLQSEDFYLRVKSDLNTVQDLIDHLETVKKKIRRNMAEGTEKEES